MPIRTGFIDFPGGKLATNMVGKVMVGSRRFSTRGESARVALAIKAPGAPILSIECGTAPGQPRLDAILAEFDEIENADQQQAEMTAKFAHAMAGMAEKNRGAAKAWADQARAAGDPYWNRNGK